MTSTTMRSAQIHFIEDPIKLIHIPIRSYGKFIQPLLQVLYPLPSKERRRSDDSPSRQVPWMNYHDFLNLSITPVECSLFCSKELATTYFGPIFSSKNKSFIPSEPKPSISTEDFLAISVEGEGLDAGQRVLELTTPLAMAGISLFFVTTYFSDYILVPSSARHKVVSALESRGFTFDNSGSNASGHHHRLSSSSLSPGSHPSSSPLSALEKLSLSQFQPSASLPDLQSRTSSLLKKHNISPEVHRELRLHHVAASRSSTPSSALQIGLMQCLAHPPAFMSMTLTRDEPASFLLEASTRARFEAAAEGGYGYDGLDGTSSGNGTHDYSSGYNGNGGSSNGYHGGARNGQSVLMGSRDVLVPVTLDLTPLGESSVGVVCGVAGKLVDEHVDGYGGSGGIEMSYLSTARGAAVLVNEEVVEQAAERLRRGSGEEEGMDVV